MHTRFFFIVFFEEILLNLVYTVYTKTSKINVETTKEVTNGFNYYLYIY